MMVMVIEQAFKRHAKRGYLALATGLPGVRLPGDIPLEEWDSWHSLICNDELSRVVSAFGSILLELDGSC